MAALRRGHWSRERHEEKAETAECRRCDRATPICDCVKAIVRTVECPDSRVRACATSQAEVWADPASGRYGFAAMLRRRPTNVAGRRRVVAFSLMASELAYVSRVKIERLGGPQRLAYLPAEDEPVAFGVHSEVAEHYGVSPDQYPPHATTLDYVVAAAGG